MCSGESECGNGHVLCFELHLLPERYEMAQENIKQFNVVVESIMLAGYSAFPHPFFSDPGALGLSGEQPQQNGLGEEFYSREWNALASVTKQAAKWMEEEGYLQVAGSGYRLSSKALRLMPTFVTGADLPLILALN
jgi:hypothetical protein